MEFGKNLNRFFPFDKDPNEKKKVKKPIIEKSNEKPKPTPYGLDRFMDKRF